MRGYFCSYGGVFGAFSLGRFICLWRDLASLLVSDAGEVKG